MQTPEPIKDETSEESKTTCPPTTVPEDQPKMSKSQMKKLAKRQRMLDGRKERRKIEKEKKKAKRRELMKSRLENGGLADLSVNIKRTKLMSESDNKFRVVIDMDFNEYMTDDEMGKAAKQVGRIYSINRHSDRPCQLYLTSLKDKILDRFAITNAGYKNWDMRISDQSYLDTFRTSDGKDCDRENLIYLTGDSDETLPQVEDLLKDESKIFVIGGLVDHNRHKNLCLTKAKELGIKNAQLPIKDHVQMIHRHILSTVTVFEILLNVLGSRMSWQDALVASIPKRKMDPKGFVQEQSKVCDSVQETSVNQVDYQASDN